MLLCSTFEVDLYSQWPCAERKMRSSDQVSAYVPGFASKPYPNLLELRLSIVAGSSRRSPAHHSLRADQPLGCSQTRKPLEDRPAYAGLTSPRRPGPLVSPRVLDNLLPADPVLVIANVPYRDSFHAVHGRCVLAVEPW